MDQVKKVTQSQKDEILPYYNYELVVSQYQILNSFQNNHIDPHPNSNFYFIKKQQDYKQTQNNQVDNNFKQLYEGKSKSDSIINLINSDSNASYQSEISKPTSIQNDFSKIKKRIVYPSSKSQTEPIKSQKKSNKNQTYLQNVKKKNQERSNNQIFNITNQNQRKKTNSNSQLNKNVQAKVLSENKKSCNQNAKQIIEVSAFNENNILTKKSNEFNNQQKQSQSSDCNQIQQNCNKKLNQDNFFRKDANLSKLHLIKTIPQFVIQSQFQNKSSLKQMNDQQLYIVKNGESQRIKYDKQEDYKVENKLTAPSLNDKNHNNEGLMWQQETLLNSRLQQDYFQFIYQQLLIKNKDNQQLKQKMNQLNQILQKQQKLRLQLNFNKQKIEQEYISISKLKNNQTTLQVKQLQEQLQYYKHVNETLDKSVQEKQKLLFQYFISKQNNLDKLENSNYSKILQLKSQLKTLNQENNKGTDKMIQMKNERLKTIFQQQRKMYLKLKAKNDGIQTGVQYLHQKKQDLILKTLRYLQCAKTNVQNALNNKGISLQNKRN